MEEFGKSSRLEGPQYKDESDWFTLLQVSKIVIYLFTITANILLCCGMYITKDVCCSLTFYVMSLIVAIMSFATGIYLLLPHYIVISIIIAYFVLCVYSLEARMIERMEEKKAREREFDRDRMKGF